MDLRNRNRFVLFAMCALAFLIFPFVLFPARLFYFAPFLVISYYQSGYAASIWTSLFCGLVVDLFSDLPFGINALAYCLSTFVLYRRKRNFFPDSAMTLSIVTFLFAVITTVSLWMILYLLGGKEGVTLKSLFSDFIVMPFYDALYAFVCFTLPIMILGKPHRRGSDYFLNDKG